MAFKFDLTKKLLKLDVDMGTGVGTKSFDINPATGEVFEAGTTTAVTAAKDLEAVSAKAAKSAKEYISKAPRNEAAAVTEMAHVKDLIGKGITGSGGKHFDELRATSKAADDLKAAIAALPTDKAATAKDLKEIKKLMAHEPEAANILVADLKAYNKLHIDTFTKADGTLVKLVDNKALDAGVTKLKASIKDLEKLHTDGKLDEKSLRDLLIKDADLIDMTPAELKNVVSATGVPGRGAVDFDAVANVVKNDITKHGNEAERLTRNVLNSQTKLEGAKFGKAPLERQVAEDVKELNEYMTKNSAFKGHVETHMNGKFAETELKTLENAKGLKGILPNLGKTAEATAEKSGKGFFKFLYKSEENLEKLATKKGVAAAEIKGWSKLSHGAQAGIIAGAAFVTYKVIAALGNNKQEPGPQAQAVLEGRSAQPELAGAAR